MGAIYNRQSSFADGDTITAALFNNELDQLEAAFAASTGHSHDGTTGEGGPITVLGPAQDISVGSTQILPTTDDAVSLGSATKEFKDAYFDGTVNLDALVIGTSTAITSVDTDLSSVSASDDTLASAKAIKTYIDAQVTAQDLDFQGDSGGALSIDLDSETLTIAGGTGIDTSGATNTLTVAIDSTVVTLTGTQTLTNKTLTTPIISSISNTGTLTLPTSTDTLVGRATTDTLTNKTINAANNTVSNIAVSMLAGSAVVTEAEGLASSDNDTSLPTTAAVIDYVTTAVAGYDTLAELLDTTITTVADNDIIAYDSTSSKYINQSAAEAGLATASDLTSHTGNTSNPHSVTKTQVGLGNVENTALSTWAGTSNITTLGTITTGVWTGTAIGDSYISSATNWNTAYGWGNHASAGYLTSVSVSGISDTTITSVTDNEVLAYDSTSSKWINQTAAEAGLATTAQIANSSNWDTAYGWGNHASAGYLTGITGQSIKNLSDVYSSMSPSDGQVLTYDTTNGWQAETPAAAGDPAGTAVAMAIALGG